MSSVQKRATLFVILAAVLLLPNAEAKRAPGPTLLEAPDEAEASIRSGNMRVSAETGAAIAIYGAGYAVTADEPEAMARQYLRANWQLLGLQHEDLNDLRHHATRLGDAGTTVRLRQYVGRVPVYGAEVTVTINPRNIVTFVMSSYKQVGEVATTPALEADTAKQAAFDYLDVEGSLRFENTDLVVYSNRGITRLAHRVSFYPQVTPVGDWEVLRDAHTGEVFRVEDRAHYAPVDGTGNVFDPDPLSSATATYGDPGFVDGNDATTPQLDGETFSRTLLDIDLTGGTHSLTGPFAAIVDHEGPFNGVFSQAGSTWAFNRFDDAFEAANVYYHIDTFMRYINVTLGCNIMPFQYAGGVQADPSGFNGADNSHYTSDGRLAFGEGGVDDAEDADVVIHELGHGIHDWVTSGNLSQVNGLSEGVGDYLAMSYSRNFNQWAPTDPGYHWVFSWDGHNPFWNGRITNYGATYPGGLTGSVHTDGQIWSTCNMRIWDELGRELTDKAFLEGLGMTNGSTNQEDAAQAVLQAATDLGYSGSDLTTMATIYQSCGYMVDTPGVIFADGFESGDTTLWQ